MARFNLIEQQTTAQLPRADPNAFGAGVARASGEMAGAAADIGFNIKRRQDVIDRVQALSDFDSEMQQDLQATVDTEDIGRPETLAGFEQRARERASKVLGKHQGWGGSRAELESQLTNQVGQYVKSARAEQVRTQQQFIGRAIEQKVNVLASKAADAPDLLDMIFESADADIGMYADAMSPEQEAKYREAARSQIASGAIDKLLQNGQWSAADRIMKDPKVVKFLDPGVARNARINIAVEQRKEQVEEKRQNDNVRRFTQLLRRDLTPMEVERIKSLPPKKDMTTADKITEYEISTDKPVPQSVVDEFYNIDNGGAGGGAFGNSLQGRALNYVTQNANAYAAGLLTPEQNRMFEAFSAEAYKPTERFDQLTGQWTKYTPTIPGFVQDALQRGGARGAAGGQRTAMVTLPDGRTFAAPVDAQGNWSFTAPDAATGINRSTADAPAASQPTNAPSTPQTPGASGRTVWERRGSVAGPVAAFTSAVNRVPGVGPAIVGAAVGEEQVHQLDADRAFVENASNDLVRVLQNNPRFSEGEREAIKKEVSISPEAWRSKESYEARLIGIADALSKRRQDAMNNLAGNISAEQRKQSMDTVQAIENFMGTLGLPVVVRTPEEARVLPPGTRFMDPKGNEWVR